MKHRVFGVLVLLGAIELLGFGVWALGQTQLMADVVPQVEPGADAKDWAVHWRLAALVCVLSGVAGVLAAIGLFLQKRWSVALLTIVSAAWLLLGLGANATGYAHYPFEAVDPVQAVLVGLFAIGSLFAYIRWSDETKPR